MRHLLVRSSSLLWLLSWSMTGWAQGTTYHFKGASFQLPTPTGFCAPDPKNDNDARLIKEKTTVMSNSGNRLMKLAASCNQLNQRDFPYDFVLYYYPVASEKESFSGTTQSMRKAVCDDLRGVTIDTKDAEDTVAKTVNELKQDMNLSKISNSKYLGLLAENAHGCYAGILATTSNSHGSYVSYADVLATVIHAKSLWVSLNTKYQNPSDSQKTLLRLQAIAAELDAKNPD